MTHDTYLKLAALSHDEDVSPELRAAIRREIDGEVQRVAAGQWMQRSDVG